MIFVTVGTEKFPFNRLLDWVADAVRSGRFAEEIVVQAGTCTNRIPEAVSHTMLNQREFTGLLKHARLVISHCGTGSFLTLRNLQKPFILVPRRHDLKEHLDNHQLELAETLSGLGVPVAWTPQDIKAFLDAPQYQEAFLSSRCLVRHFIERFEPLDSSRK